MASQSGVQAMHASLKHSARPLRGGRQLLRVIASQPAGAPPAAAAAPSVVLPPASLSQARVLFATAGAPGHDMLGHPECAARVPAILQALQEQGLVSRPEVVELTGFGPASREHVLAVHNPKFVGALERMKGEMTQVDSAPTYVTPTTAADSYLAAGAVLALVDNVVAASRQQQREASSSGTGSTTSNNVPAGFAICRPPGHHSVPDHAMGFCIFSNAAIAARYAQRQHGLQKVLIYDFDVHHGNGTEAAFYSDPDVLFISTHQDGSYPNTGKLAYAGMGAGEGANVNVPLPGDSGQQAALAAWEEVIEPAARRFAPDIILVSAGYDAHWRDPLAGLQFRNSTYHELGRRLKHLADDLCSGRLVFLLEGGYDLPALSESVANTFLGVLGEAPADKFNPDLLRDEPLDRVRAVLAEVQLIHGI